MISASYPKRSAKVIRWIARSMSILIAMFVILRIITPDPYAAEPIPFEDWFLLSFWGVAVAGLLIAWRWELVGSLITIITMLLRELAWVIIKGGWMVNFLIFWVVVIPPAVLFLISWGLSQNKQDT